jgi:hypothetical protein
MDGATLLQVLAITLLLFGAGVLAMAIGVVFRRPCLRGSCGGANCSCARSPGTGRDRTSSASAEAPQPRQ